MSSAASQISCFSTIQNRFNLTNASHILPSQLNLFSYLRVILIPAIPFFTAFPFFVTPSLRIVMNSDRLAIKVSSSGSRPALKFTAKTSKSDNDILDKPLSNIEDSVNGDEISEPVENAVIEPVRAAKIHDFCFGIPYGGIVLIGGLVSFLFSRNTATLMSGGLYGGGLLALSIISLKVWGQGHSSLLFILGQAGIAAALLWKNMQTYSLTKRILPAGFNIVISAAMLCFYAYVVVSGGNPPPKKLKAKAAAAAAAAS